MTDQNDDNDKPTILERVGRRRPTTEIVLESTRVASEQYVAFRQRASNAQVHKVDIIRKDGTRFALDYSYLTRINFDRETITLIFPASSVSLEGRNLLPLYTALVSHSVASITEIDTLHADAEDLATEDCVVTGIREDQTE